MNLEIKDRRSKITFSKEVENMVSIFRKDLYEKLWSIGTSKTANELNVPYNKLKSACISNEIPMPTASYWSRLYMGKEKPTQSLLPNPEDNPEIIIEQAKVKSATPQKILSPKKEKDVEITPNNDDALTNDESTKQQGYFSYLEGEQTVLTQIFNVLKVNKTLSTSPHKEIVKYRQKKKDGSSYYREAILHINSSSGVLIPETLPFIDSLFKALEKAGARINITHDETKVLYKSYVFMLNFKLPSKKVMLSPDDKEYSSYKTYKYVSTGYMNVEVGYYLEWRKWSKHEKLIKQTKTDTFDALLKKVFLYIFSLPQIIDEERMAHQIAEEKKRREEEQREIIRERHDREYQRTEELLQKSIHYFYSQIVEKYVMAEFDEDTEEYQWAMNKADWIKDSDKYPDKLLTTKDKEKLIIPKQPKGFLFD